MGLWYWCLSLLILGTVCVQTVQSQKSKTDKAKPGCPAAPEESLQDVQKNISALWQEVGKLQQPVHVHIHGDGHMMDGHHDHANHSDDHHDDHHGQHGDNLDDHHDDHHSDHHGDHHAHHVQHDDPKADKSKSKKKADKKKDDKMMPGKGMPDDDDDDDDDGHTDHKHPVNASRTAHHGHHSEDSHHDPDGTHVHIHLHMGPDEAHHMHESHSTETLHARCNVEPNKNLTANQRQDVKGTIYLQQKHGKSLEAKVDLKGFDHSHGGKDPGEHAHLHGLHVHEYGDMKYGCNSLGGHFNPSKAKHGGPKDKHSHAGDWGNLHVDEDGTINTILADQIPRSIGINNILGRGIVIHADADDLGKQNSTASITTGSAGLRLACCIVVATEEPPGIWV